MLECTCCVCWNKFARSQRELKVYEAEGRQFCVHEGWCETTYRSRNPNARFVRTARASDGRVELTDPIIGPATARATQTVQ